MSTTIKVCPVCSVSWYADKPEKHMMTCTAKDFVPYPDPYTPEELKKEIELGGEAHYPPESWPARMLATITQAQTERDTARIAWDKSLAIAMQYLERAEKAEANQRTPGTYETCSVSDCYRRPDNFNLNGCKWETLPDDCPLRAAKDAT